MLQWLERCERSLSESESRSAGLKERAAHTLCQVFTPSLPSKSMRVKIVKPSVPMDGWLQSFPTFFLWNLFKRENFSAQPARHVYFGCFFWAAGSLMWLPSEVKNFWSSTIQQPVSEDLIPIFYLFCFKFKSWPRNPRKNDVIANSRLILIIVNQLRKLWIKDKQHEGQGQIFYNTRGK